MRSLRLLVNGPCGLWRLRDLDAVWPGCSFTSFAAYFRAIYRYKGMYGLEAAWTRRTDLNAAEVLRRTADEYLDYLSAPGHRSRLQLAPRKGSRLRQSHVWVGATSVEWDGLGASQVPVQLELLEADDWAAPVGFGVTKGAA